MWVGQTLAWSLLKDTRLSIKLEERAERRNDKSVVTLVENDGYVWIGKTEGAASVPTFYTQPVEFVLELYEYSVGEEENSPGISSWEWMFDFACGCGGCGGGGRDVVSLVIIEF